MALCLGGAGQDIELLGTSRQVDARAVGLFPGHTAVATAQVADCLVEPALVEDPIALVEIDYAVQTAVLGNRQPAVEGSIARQIVLALDQLALLRLVCAGPLDIQVYPIPAPC